MEQNDKTKVYLAGDIMSFGSNLARQYEYDTLNGCGLDLDIYSPVMNKSINDKSNVTEEENNHLAEKITEADIDRLWNSDVVVMCPEQSAIGSLCETGTLFGWKYMSEKLHNLYDKYKSNPKVSDGELLDMVMTEIERIASKKDYFHYFDLRTNHLNEKDWRRSFSINQLLYGMILATSESGDIDTFDDIVTKLKADYAKPSYKSNPCVSCESYMECLHDAKQGNTQHCPAFATYIKPKAKQLYGE